MTDGYDVQNAAERSERCTVRAETLDKAIVLAEKAGHVFIATANANGAPHITVAGSMEKTGPDSLGVKEWFCPGTVRNLRENEQISIVIWEKEEDFGYQLMGHLKELKNTGVLNGFSPMHEGRTPFPQIEMQLIIRIERILFFSAAPHTDVQET